MGVSALGEKNCEIKYYDSVISKAVKWLWYPYIPFGKLTIVQGDPGDGKSTFLLNLAALLTLGKPLPGNDKTCEPMTVIYQNAEDGIEDTIKPRLESLGADCKRVAYLDDDMHSMSLTDESIEKAIARSSAKLLIIDPVQAYLGDVDMNRASDIRAVMKKIAKVAERTGCAVVLVGHMNKAVGGKSIYRGLGSIDFTAAVRSVLLVGKVKDDPGVRAVLHIKSNLAPEGNPLAFELSENYGFRWIEGYAITQDELLSDAARPEDGKAGEAIKIISESLAKGQKLAVEIIAECKKAGIGTRTAETAKRILGIISVKRQDKWYWLLPISKE
jgi:archaellum biogenesis ATPase FlaH